MKIAILNFNMTSFDKDERMIALLREDARQSVAELARKTNVSRTAAQARLERLERSGVIEGYTVRLSSKFSRNRVRALVMIKSPPRGRGRVESALGKISALVTLHSISGHYDLAAEISAPTVEDLDAVIDQIGEIEGVTDTLSSVILSTKLER